MIQTIVTFLIVAIVSWLIGFTSLAFAAAEIARYVFYISIVLFVGSVAFYLMKKPTNKM